MYNITPIVREIYWRLKIFWKYFQSFLNFLCHLPMTRMHLQEKVLIILINFFLLFFFFPRFKNYRSSLRRRVKFVVHLHSHSGRFRPLIDCGSTHSSHFGRIFSLCSFDSAHQSFDVARYHAHCIVQ